MEILDPKTGKTVDVPTGRGRPRQHPANIRKLPRDMAAWRYGYDVLPEDVARWVLGLDNGDWTVVSPNTGHSTVFAWGWWIIQTEVGCLYAIPDRQFRKKYELRPTRLPKPPISRGADWMA